jgi:hypothetical protein
MKLLTRSAALLFVFCLAIVAQLLVVSTAEITCDSATHALSTAGVARWVQLVAPTANAAVIRWGDSNTAAARGAIIAPGGGQMLPAVPGFPGYDLTKIYYYCTASDKLEIVYAK